MSPGAPPTRTGQPSVGLSGIGTVAPRAVRGALLQGAIERAGLTIGEVGDADDPESLLNQDYWDLALVLSPWKQRIAKDLHVVCESSRRSGVVDTVVRHDGRCVGVNTNTFAAQAAMTAVSGGLRPERVIILGSGGTAHSVAAAVRRLWDDVGLVGSARRPAALGDWSRHFDADVVPSDGVGSLAGRSGRVLVVNTTTWGETEESEESPFAFDLDTLLRGGDCLFDLNNRTSLLQTRALAAGMTVMSGIYMQKTTNSCRAALLNEVRHGGSGI